MTLSVSIARAELARGLKLASSVAARGKTLPILSSVLLRANGTGTLKIAATDLNVSLTAELPCRVNGQGSIALPAGDLARFVAGALGEDVTIVADGSVRADVKVGKAKFRIAGLHDRDFPKLPIAPDASVEVDAKALHDALSRSGYAVSPDESRQACCGVLLEVSGETARWYSTDGHRLVAIERKMAIPKVAKRISIGSVGAATIVRLLANAEACRVAIDSRIHVSAGGITVSAGLLDFEVPSADRFMAIKHKHTATATRDRLVEAIKRVAPLTNEYHGVTITSTQTGLSVIAKDTDGQELSDEIECEVKGEIRFAAHSKYMLEALTNMTGDVATLRCSGALDPIVFVDHDDAGYTAVVMPMRID